MANILNTSGNIQENSSENNLFERNTRIWIISVNMWITWYRAFLNTVRWTSNPCFLALPSIQLQLYCSAVQSIVSERISIKIQVIENSQNVSTLLKKAWLNGSDLPLSTFSTVRQHFGKPVEPSTSLLSNTFRSGKGSVTKALATRKLGS